MRLPLSWWQAIFLWPGMSFMDWLARNYPTVVIRHGFGFTVESYVFWSALISAAFWSMVLALVLVAWGRLRRRFPRRVS